MSQPGQHNLSSAFFLPLGGGRYEPTESTIGPWAPGTQHGGPPGALLMHALSTYPSDHDLQIARITIEILGPVPIGACEVSVERLRGGKRIELLRAQYAMGGKVYMTAQAWRTERIAGIVERKPGSFVVPTMPSTETAGFFQGIDYFPYGHALEWRFVEGGFDQLGPATVWARARIPLVEGCEISGLESLILMIDSANGVSAVLDIRQWSYVPVDLSVGLFRLPVGPWVGMSARTVIEPDGIGQTMTTAFDSAGAVGHSMQTLFVRPQ